MLSLAELDRFFEELDKEFGHPLNILITGAVAGFIMGHIRPSDDIDFEVLLPDKNPPIHLKEKLEASIKQVSLRLGIPAQYTENIGGWSQITLLDYREQALFYKKIGHIEIKFLAPEYWAIGKLTRYLPLDSKDLISVLKANQVDALKLTAHLAKALRSSPLSDRSREFKDHVLDFLKNDGKKIWGEDFIAETYIRQFKNQAGMGG
jgi:hypothetical protein